MWRDKRSSASSSKPFKSNAQQTSSTQFMHHLFSIVRALRFFFALSHTFLCSVHSFDLLQTLSYEHENWWWYFQPETTNFVRVQIEIKRQQQIKFRLKKKVEIMWIHKIITILINKPNGFVFVAFFYFTFFFCSKRGKMTKKIVCVFLIAIKVR